MGNKKKAWKCLCDCGNEKIITHFNLVYGGTKSCGCLRIEKLKERIAKREKKQDQNVVGQKFGLLLVLKDGYSRIDVNGYVIKRCLCKCDCGKEIIVDIYALLNGHIKSCGCTRKENFKYIVHGKSKDPLYIVYGGMKNRCYIKSNQEYENYGGRGIKVCDEWLGENGFSNFYDWSIKNGYKKGLTIDRINNDGNYEPSNCRWITRKEQSKNTSRNLYITYKGETHLLCEWVNILNISWGKIRYRYYHNNDLITGEKLNEDDWFIPKREYSNNTI